MVERSVNLGFSGIEVPLGAHICAFYQGRAGLDEVMIPYLAEGLRGGEKCLGVVESSELDQVRDLLASTDEDGRVPGQVEVMIPADTYLRGGRFSTEAMMSWLTEQVSHSLDVEGFARVRSAGEMGWALSDPSGVSELFSYEMQLNKFAASFPQVVLCLYDMDRVGGSMLIDAMKTHPQVLVGTLLCESPFYVDPDVYAEERARSGQQ
jgi:hypothetical protein